MVGNAADVDVSEEEGVDGFVPFASEFVPGRRVPPGMRSRQYREVSPMLLNESRERTNLHRTGDLRTYGR